MIIYTFLYLFLFTIYFIMAAFEYFSLRQTIEWLLLWVTMKVVGIPWYQINQVAKPDLPVPSDASCYEDML